MIKRLYLAGVIAGLLFAAGCAFASDEAPTTVLVKWPLAPGTSRAEAAERMQSSIPAYKGREGLIRKYIAINAEAGHGYGIYLWDSRALAEAFYAEMAQRIEQSTGAPPQIEYLETTIIVDNRADEVQIYD